ncbi:hypothetical protein Y032_0057g2831 [Ancylostoma ceylanicum]|uniref:7TM GPCR serpentine receptor class x (Srx) domain-containing protein n=1 Tax=Ancylostoma ceylanicum TaxID=53326 RepID=A0A016U6K0_9BILA|nr:hypothetical protein Y032_0057g2831 [Ancylostoma ceylanicum]
MLQLATAISSRVNISRDLLESRVGLCSTISSYFVRTYSLSFVTISHKACGMEMLDGYPDLKTMDIVAGVIMIVLGIAGSLINVTVIVLMVKTTQFQNAFGYVCISQLVADTFELLINIFWTGPSTLL